MARRILLVVSAAAFFAIGLLMADDQAGRVENTAPADVVGTVVTVEPDQMTVRTAQNEEWKFKLNDQTQRLPGIAVGDRVRVSYKDEWGTDVARSITLDSTPTAMKTSADAASVPAEGRGHLAPPLFVVGTVVSSGPTEFMITTDAGERRTFRITPGMIRTHIVEGERVRVNFEEDSSQMTARAVVPASYEMARNDLPNTASSLPVVALVGMLSLLTGSALWLRRNRIG